MVIKEGKLVKLDKEDICNGGFATPQGVHTIGSQSIASLPELKELHLSPEVHTIEKYAIIDTGLREFTIPETVTSVGVGGLAGNAKLTRVIIRNIELKVQGHWFQGCPILNTVRIGLMEYHVINYDWTCYEILDKKKIDDNYISLLVTPFKGESDKKSYIVVSQNSSAQEDTLDKALKMCKHHETTRDLKEKYRDLDLDTKVSIIDYKTIVGKCDKTIEQLLENNGFGWDSKRTLRELLSLLDRELHRSQYREFVQFVADRYKDRDDKRDDKRGKRRHEQVNK